MKKYDKIISSQSVELCEFFKFLFTKNAQIKTKEPR